ncbi:MAG TPA: DUF309 domain-containing protein [Pirellulaceae bacterium]|nr:DUF309 domain-containing protein [Pirellulaceae bacterium]
MPLLRWCPERALPPYSYVPGLFPHPFSDPSGHCYGQANTFASTANIAWTEQPLLLFGIDLFNHGYYWEAHEAWEAVWNLVGRSGTPADFVKGLIKLAAAGVKAREGRSAGVVRHATRARALFQQVAATQPREDQYAGFSLSSLLAFAQAIETNAVELIDVSSSPVVRIFSQPLERSPSSA